MEIRPLTHVDINSMWDINEQGLPGTGKVSLEEIGHLLDISELALGVYEGEKLLGFVLCLLPKMHYGSLNYAWFNERYEQFIYVDRIAVRTNSRDRGVGSLLYREVINYSKKHDVIITAEVSLKPPNEGSMRFHYRFGFSDVGILEHESKSVTLMIREK
tara:strand:+ start:987 stop:1463 length:477 start_codon:yes stop_codon:yes gene_type:complete